MATSPPSSGRPPAPGGGGFSLAKKVGPLPIWAYMAVIVVALYVYEKKKKAGTATSAATAVGATGSGSATAPAQGSDAASQSALEQSLAANVSAPTTNPQWEANAESILVGYGYPMVQVQAALNTYLAGGVLSSIQQEIVNATIEAAGAPPSPPTTPSASASSPTVAATPVAAPTPPTQAAPPPASTGTSGPGYGIVSIGGQSYIHLGQDGGLVYQVSQGAPVYFGGLEGVQQGATAEHVVGTNAYTPVQYAAEVSAQPSPQTFS